STGFIGHPIALAFSRAGHIVYAQTRSASTAKQLAKEELIPVVGDPTSQEGQEEWLKVAESVDVVIDTVPAMGFDVPLKTFKLVEELSKDRPDGAKITYIYTGGSWVHSRGTGGLDTWTSEQQPHSGQNVLTAWRWNVEKEVLASKQVQGIVIRPSNLYGSSGSLFSMFLFKPAYEAANKSEEFDVILKSDTRLLTVHQDDLADLYVRCAERAPICKGQAFVAANPLSERFTDILDAVVRVSGAKGYTSRPPSDHPLEVAWQSTTNMKPTLGHALTGWTPKKMGIVDGMNVYWSSFVASLE
ncbi:hypothetical protein BCR39DRAFT_466725, partial [Naematelia encephala]